MTYQSDASTELNSGASPRSGNRFGSMPSETAPAHSTRMSRASASRPVARHRPRKAMNASRPQSVNHGYPATMVRPGSRRTRYAEAARSSGVGKASRRRRSATRASFTSVTTSSAIEISRASVTSARRSQTACWSGPESGQLNSPGEPRSSVSSRPRSRSAV